jgi:spore coat polysaccharide biosynthesis predicted glycosyltransferase SpsG
MGVPAVALPVVAAQTPTVRAFAQRGAAIAMPAGAQAREAADAAVKLLNNPRQRAALARRSTQLVDGKGALRAAAAVARLAAGTDRDRQCLLIGSPSEPTFAQRG